MGLMSLRSWREGLESECPPSLQKLQSSRVTATMAAMAALQSSFTSFSLSSNSFLGQRFSPPSLDFMMMDPLSLYASSRMVATNQRYAVKLRYFPPDSNTDIVVDLPPQENIEKWEACLVGHFLDRNLNFNYVKTYAFNLWREKGLREVISTSNGFIFFLFDSSSNSASVLEDGPWFFGGHFLILKKWHKMMKLTKMMRLNISPGKMQCNQSCGSCHYSPCFPLTSLGNNSHSYFHYR